MRNKNYTLFAIKCFFACAAFALLCSFSLLSFNSKVGEKVGDFKLKNTNGQFLSLSNIENAKGFIVVFICNHCPCSGQYESRITALDKKYKVLGYPVIAINSMDPDKYTTESLELMKARASMKGYTFPYLSDPDKKTAISYGAVCTPYACIIQKSGVDLIMKYEGAIDDNMQRSSLVKNKYIETALNELLSGESVKNPSTRSFGCSLY